MFILDGCSQDCQMIPRGDVREIIFDKLQLVFFGVIPASPIQEKAEEINSARTSKPMSD